MTVNPCRVAVALLSLWFVALPAFAQTDADRAAIHAAALDYIEGWYTGNGERMERAVHPDLAKRIVRTDPVTRASSLGQQSAATLVQSTRAGGGEQTPERLRLKDVTILDVYQNAASVKIVASDWIDYLHLARWNGAWKIVNVLWERKAASADEGARRTTGRR